MTVASIPPSVQGRGMRYLGRTILTHIRNRDEVDPDIDATVQKLWPTDKVTRLLTRASTVAATPTGVKLGRSAAPEYRRS
jgi:hypothetical protein